MDSPNGHGSCPLRSVGFVLGSVVSGRTPMRLRPFRQRQLLYLLGPRLPEVSSVCQTLPTSSPLPYRRTCSRSFLETPTLDGLPLMGIRRRSPRLSSLH